MNQDYLNALLGLAVIGLSIAVYRQQKIIQQMQAPAASTSSAAKVAPEGIMQGWGDGDITAGSVKVAY